MTDTQFEKFKSLTEEVDFSDQDTFREKLGTLKESYFPKVNSSETYDNDDDNYGSVEQDIDTTDAMKRICLQLVVQKNVSKAFV